MKIEGAFGTNFHDLRKETGRMEIKEDGNWVRKEDYQQLVASTARMYKALRLIASTEDPDIPKAIAVAVVGNTVICGIEGYPT